MIISCWLYVHHMVLLSPSSAVIDNLHTLKAFVTTAREYHIIVMGSPTVVIWHYWSIISLVIWYPGISYPWGYEIIVTPLSKSCSSQKVAAQSLTMKWVEAAASDRDCNNDNYCYVFASHVFAWAIMNTMVLPCDYKLLPSCSLNIPWWNLVCFCQNMGPNVELHKSVLICMYYLDLNLNCFQLCTCTQFAKWWCHTGVRMWTYKYSAKKRSKSLCCSCWIMYIW